MSRPLTFEDVLLPLLRGICEAGPVGDYTWKFEPDAPAGEE